MSLFQIDTQKYIYTYNTIFRIGTKTKSLYGSFHFQLCCVHISFPRGATYDDFSCQYVRIFEIIIFCYVLAICDLVHAVEAMYGLL